MFLRTTSFQLENGQLLSFNSYVIEGTRLLVKPQFSIQLFFVKILSLVDKKKVEWVKEEHVS